MTDEFLLGVGGMSATLVGLFLVGMFFYAETALRSGDAWRLAMAAYIRASARIVLLLYAIPIALSLTLVILDDQWSRILFALLSLLLIWANVDTVRRLSALPRLREWPLLIGTELVGTLITIVIVVGPWALSGLMPGRPELTIAVLLSFGAGFLGICTMVLTAFDLVRLGPETVADVAATVTGPDRVPAPPAADRPRPGAPSTRTPVAESRTPDLAAASLMPTTAKPSRSRRR